MTTIAPTSDHVYRRLQSQILLGRIKAGQRMTLAGLAKRFNTPTSVVRTSVRRLQKQGLVESRRKWGTYVKEHSLDDWLDYLRLREGVEGMAARRVAEVIGGEQLQVLYELIGEFRRAADVQLAARSARERLGLEMSVIDADRNFHQAMIRFAQSPLLERVYRDYDIHPIASVIDGRSVGDAGFDRRALAALLDETHRQHVELCDAIKARDADRAEAAARTHIRAGADRLREWKRRQLRDAEVPAVKRLKTVP